MSDLPSNNLNESKRNMTYSEIVSEVNKNISVDIIIENNTNTNLDDSNDFKDQEFFNLINEENITHNGNKTPSLFSKVIKSHYISINGDTLDTSNNLGVASELCSIDLNPSNDPNIRLMDDMMNDPNNQTKENWTQVRSTIIKFALGNPISYQIGDLLYRLALKHLSELIHDNQGALECFDHALKIYLQYDSTRHKSHFCNNMNVRTAETFKRRSDCYLHDGDIVNASNNLETSLGYYSLAYGENSYEVAECIFKKGVIFQYQGEWKEAEKFFQIALDIIKTLNDFNDDTEVNMLEISNPIIGDCHFKLGVVNEKLEDYGKSEECYLTALNIYQRFHGGQDNNELCYLAYFNLGVIAEATGNNDKAIKYYLKSKDIIKTLKPDHLDYVDVQIKLANLYYMFEKENDAEACLEEALSIVKKDLNFNIDFQTLLTLLKNKSEKINVLIEICYLISKICSNDLTNKFDKSLQNLKLVIYLMPIESEYLEAAFILLIKHLEEYNTGKYSNVENYKIDFIESIIFLMDKLEAEKGCDSFTIIQNSNTKIQKGYSDFLFSEIDMNSLMIVPSEINDNYNLPTQRLGEIFYELSRVCSKIGIFIMTLELSIRSINFLMKVPEDIIVRKRICDILNTIGIEFNKFGKTELSIKYFEKNLEFRIKYYGIDDLKTAGAYNNIAIGYDKLKMYDESIKNWKKTIEIRLKLLPKHDLKIANSFYNLSLMFGKIKDYKSALENMLKALEIYDKKSGSDSLFSADAAYYIGEYYKNLNKPSHAIIYLQRSYDCYCIKNEIDDFNTLKSKLMLGITLSLVGQHKKAISYLEPIKDYFDPEGDEEGSAESNAETISKSIPEIALEMWLRLGISYDHINEYLKALKTFEKLVLFAKEVWTPEKISEINSKISDLNSFANAVKGRLKK